MWDTKNGFSLIELIVAMGILAVLAAGMVSLIGTGSRQYARDVDRKSDLEQVRSALELYRNSGTGYIVNVGDTAATALSALVPAYTSAVPDDPQTTRHYYYVGAATTYTICAALEKGTGTVTGCGGASACGVACNYKVIQP